MAQGSGEDIYGSDDNNSVRSDEADRVYDEAAKSIKNQLKQPSKPAGTNQYGGGKSSGGRGHGRK